MAYRPWESHAPAALLALTAAARNYVTNMTYTGPGDKPQVFYGPTMAETSHQNVISVGWTGFVPGYQYPTRIMSEQLYAAVATEDVVASGLVPESRETFSIGLASMVRTGSTHEEDRSQAVQCSYDNMKVIGSVLGPPWLSGTVASAVMSTPVSTHFVQDRRGFLALVTFRVKCVAWAQQLWAQQYAGFMKKCSACQQVKPLAEFHRNRAQRDGLQNQCKDCRREINKGRRAKVNEYSRRYRETHHGQHLERHRRYYQENREAHYAKMVEYRKRVKAKVLAHYGTSCACCGKAEDLSIDHIDGTGAQHRRDLFGRHRIGGHPFYRWLILNGFPAGFQVLCRPCNRSKSTGERCNIHALAQQ